MNSEKQRLINADELKKEIIRIANKSSLGEISTNTDLPLGAVIGLINDAPTILYRRVVKR